MDALKTARHGEKGLTGRQRDHLMRRIEQEGAALGLELVGSIGESGPNPRKPGSILLNHHFTVVVRDTASGEDIEVPANILNYPDLAAWWRKRGEAGATA